MQFGFHGNYCGPGWTDGQHIDADKGSFDKDPIDYFDSTCKEHDKSYQEGDYLDADNKFFKQNFGYGFKQTAAATLVFLQARLRDLNLMAKKKSKAARKAAIKQEKKAVVQQIEKMQPMGRVKAAMPKQVKAAPVAIAMGSKAGKSKTIVNGKSLDRRTIVTGNDQLGAILANASLSPTSQGSVLMQFTISPQNFTDQRLGVFSTLYDRYRFRKFNIKYRPQVGTSVGGELIAYYEYDPTDVNPSGVALVNRALSSSTVKTFSVWDRFDNFSLNASLCKGEFYTTPGYEQRIVNQAVFYIVSNTTFGGSGAAVQTLGNVEVSYEIEFYGNDITPSNSMVMRNEFAMMDSDQIIFPLYDQIQLVPLKTIYPQLAPKIAQSSNNPSKSTNFFIEVNSNTGCYLVDTIVDTVTDDGSNRFTGLQIVPQQGVSVLYEHTECGGLSSSNGYYGQSLIYKFVYYYEEAENERPNNFNRLVLQSTGLAGINGNINYYLQTYSITKLSDSKDDYVNLGKVPTSTLSLQQQVEALTARLDKLLTQQVPTPAPLPNVLLTPKQFSR